MIRRIYNINRCRMGPIKAWAAAIWDAIADGVLSVIEQAVETYTIYRFAYVTRRHQMSRIKAAWLAIREATKPVPF